MLIGELAERTDVTAKTIRYYEKIGLMPTPERNESGYRIYTDEDAERLEFILRAKVLDFSLAEIGEILTLREQDEVPCRYVAHQIESKLDEIERKIARLQRLREELRHLHEHAQSIRDEEQVLDTRICHLIEAPAPRTST